VSPSLSATKYSLQTNYPTEAMDRIHRLGQHRPVQAIKLVVEDSIESRIVQVYTSFSRSPHVSSDASYVAAREEICDD
jgi:hypothetical protein